MRALVFLLIITALSSFQDQKKSQVIYGSNKGNGKYIEINDIKMYYEVYGAGEPLILLHGGGGSIEDFSSQIPELSKYFKVYAVDSRGQGRSTDSDQELTYALMASDVSSFIDKLQLGSVNILGWSDGGNTGLELAYAHPDKVKKLIVSGANYTHVNCSAPDDGVKMDPDNPLLIRMKPHVLQFRENSKKLNPDTAKQAAVRKKLNNLWANYPNFTIEQLKEIKTPTLVISGDHDLFTLEHTISMFRAIPNSQLFIVPGASHIALVEQPELLNNVIVKFLQQPFTKINNMYFLKFGL